MNLGLPELIQLLVMLLIFVGVVGGVVFLIVRLATRGRK